MNLLFTSAGRRVELLRSFRRAIKALELQGNIIATDIDPLAPALQVCDRFYIVPRFNSTDYIPVLSDICHREKINLIFPLVDPDIPVLAKHREVLESTNARVAVVSASAAQIADDKWLSTRFFQSLGLKTPRAWLPESIDASCLNFPLFIKPRNGSAGQQTYKVNSLQELEFFLGYVPNPIIQEFMPGPEITNDVICDLEGGVLAVVSRQRIEVRWGEVAKGVTVYNSEISDACTRIARALPAVGPITVQCMMKAGIPHFTEINARMGGGIPLGIAAGADSPRWLLARAADIQVDIPPIGSYQVGLYITRFDESFFLTNRDHEQMASHTITALDKLEQADRHLE